MHLLAVIWAGLSSGLSTLKLSRDMTKPTKWVCAQRRLRSARASAQSDQSLGCVLNGLLRTQAFFMQTVRSLIRLGGCPGWSESSLGAQSLCWFCHVMAQIVLALLYYAPNFEEVVGAYWFRVVRVCVHSSKTVHARALKFHIWIPHGKIADTRFFLVRVISLSGVIPLWKNQNEIWCMNHAC